MDKAFIGEGLKAVILLATGEISEKGGANVTPSQAEEIFVATVSKYDGLTGQQFLEKFKEVTQAEKLEERRQEEDQKRIAQEKEAAKYNAQKQEQAGKETETNEKINRWLAGSPAESRVGEEELPGRATLQLSYDEPSKTLAVAIEFLGWDGKTDKTGRINTIAKVKLSDDLSTLTDWEWENENMPVRNNSSSELWFLPKFKEWAAKFISLSDSERPEQFIKEIPQNPAGNEKTVWFIYDKNYGPGVLALSRGGYSQDDARNEVMSRRLQGGGGEMSETEINLQAEELVKSVNKQISDLVPTLNVNIWSLLGGYPRQSFEFELPSSNGKQSFDLDYYSVSHLYMASAAKEALENAQSEIAGKSMKQKDAADEAAAKREAISDALNLE